MAVVVVVVVPAVAATHAAAGPTGGAVPPQLVEVIDIAGEFGIPADASMVAANVTAVNPAADGFLTVFSCDEPQPTTSNVNYRANQVAPNLVLSRIADDGTICIATRAVTDVVVDLVGYVPAESALVPLAVPVRAIDTRGPAGDQPPLAAGGVLEIPIAGTSGVDADATVVLFNLTAVAADRPGFLTAYPCGAPPSTSSVNYLAGQVVPNLVVARLSPAGSVCISTLSPAHVIVDIAAFATEGIETLAVPERVLDTRETTGLLPAGATTTVGITARADVPDDATGAIYNLTSVGATGPGYATSYPCDDEVRPDASNLNYDLGQVVANQTITRLSTGGQLCIFNLSPTHLVVDLAGYVRGTDHYVPITPARALDTRVGWQPCGLVLTTTVDDGWYLHRAGGGSTRLVFPDDVSIQSGILDPDCEFVVGTDSANDIWKVDVDGGPPERVYGGDGYVQAIGVLTDGTIVARSGQFVLTVDGAGQLQSLIEVDSLSDPVWISTDGSTITQRVLGGDVHQWDVATGTERAFPQPPGWGFAGPSPSGRLLMWLDVPSAAVEIRTPAGTVVHRLASCWTWANEFTLLCMRYPSFAMTPFAITPLVGGPSVPITIEPAGGVIDAA